jgi:4-carboxymuconolactone decarboxylase
MTPPADDQLRNAYAKRRAVLGDAYVDSQVAADDAATREFHYYLTSMAWGDRDG